MSTALQVAGPPNWAIDMHGNEETHYHIFIIGNNRVHEGGKTGIFAAFKHEVNST